MGAFTDAFGINVGMRLGDLAVQQGMAVPKRILDSVAMQYQMDYFDPVVRSDLCELMATGSLTERAYPFPTEETEPVGKKDIFFLRHKIFTILLVLCGFNMFLWTKNSGSYRDTENLGLLFILLLFTGIAIWAKWMFRGIKDGGKKLIDKTYKTQMDFDGEQYWKIREYIRKTLSAGEMNQKEAIFKLSSTRLAQQFPDTLGEIEANAYNYQQALRNRRI